MQFRRLNNTADRDWRDRQEVSAEDYRALYDDLGGDPEGDCVLIELIPPGSESTALHRWRVHGPGTSGEVA